jgi:CRISPR-associated endonuclease/helicase Cas3
MTVYAKSNRETLSNHTENALKVFKSVKSLFPYIPNLCRVDDFWKHLFLAVFFHDFGKSASGFQKSLDGFDWNYRHEILSAGFVLNLPLAENIRKAITLAVISHHYGQSYIGENYRTYGIGEEAGKTRWKAKVEEMKENQDYLFSLIEKIPNWSNKYLGEEITLQKNAAEIDNFKDAIELCIRLMNNESERDEFVSSFPDKSYLLFLRGLTIACDHLASAEKKEIIPGIQEVYSKLTEANRLKELRGFQDKMMKISSSAYLAAPTGSGKTDAALLWCQRNQDAGRRIFYVLPYTASINAMQNELKNIFCEEKVGILHHKADYFVYKSFMEQGYSVEQSLKLMKETTNITKKIYRPIKVLTPYQIIKAFYGVKGFEAILSEMAGALFIFDEIHCYDPRTVALTVRSVEELNKFGAKFLFMSATLPRFLRKLFSEAVSDIPFVTPDPSDEKEKKLLTQARHKISLLDGEITEHTDKIKKYLGNKKRVLVVCNSVKRAQEIYKKLKSLSKKSHLIHGRFIARDRERIEREISSVNLLVGTQAIEVSLNFDFDVLFTEPAPIDALLQRFGRVNRFGKSKEPVPVFVCKEGSEADEYIYKDRKRVTDTLNLLRDGEPLTNQKASKLVEELYKQGYNEKEREEYAQAYKDFDFVVRHLPLFDESEFREEFFELIKSREVVPIRFQDEYLRLKSGNKYLEAVGYIVPISIDQYYRLIREGRISRVNYDIFVDAKYDEEFGLILDKREDIISSKIL